MYYLLCGCAFCFWFMQALLKGNDHVLYGNSRKYRYRRNRIGVLTEILANLHTPLKDRVTVCRMVSGSYEMAQATGTDPDPNGTAPKMEILYQAQDAGTEAAMKSNDSYTVNPNNITG